MTLPINDVTSKLMHPEKCIEHIDPASLQLWLDNGLDPNLADSEGMTLLIHSLGYRNIECCRVLLAAGADPNLSRKNSSSVLLPIHFAVRIAHVNAFNLLIEYGADITLPGFNNDKSVVESIVKRDSCTEMLQALLMKGLKADKTLLNMAISAKQKRNVAALLRHGLEMGGDSWVYAITSDMEDYIIALQDDIRLRKITDSIPLPGSTKASLSL